MDRTIFIHAGMHKTGSTAIQMFLSRNRDRLHELGIYLPVAGSEIHAHNHAALVSAVAHIDQTGAGGTFGKLQAELAQADYPRQIVISAEDFSPKFGRQPYLDNLSSFCAALGYAPHLVVYVRPQASAINAMFTQNVKNWRAERPFHEFFAARLAAPFSHFPRLFEALHADSRFRLTIRPYSQKIIKTGLIADILAILGLPADDPGFMHSPDLVNVTPGPKAVAAFLQIRRGLAEKAPAPQPAVLKALTRPLIAAAGRLGWNATKFDGIDAGRLRHAQIRLAESNESFAQSVWQERWYDVFPEEEDRQASPNIFIFKDASPSEQAEFRDFVREAIATIRQYDAGTVQSPAHDLDDGDD